MNTLLLATFLTCFTPNSQNVHVLPQNVGAIQDLISGDFDGNGNKDYALQVLLPKPVAGPRERIAVVFLRQGTSYAPFVLASGSVDPGLELGLHLVKKGSKGKDFELDVEFTYPFDAIDIVSEKGSVTYLWKGGRFQAIITAD